MAIGSPPKVLDRQSELALVAADPEIVTPIGITFDSAGQLLVIESHTHFRPEGYDGPAADRIRRVHDDDGDGRADRFSTFFEGETALMSLRVSHHGDVYAATRMRIFRLRDRDRDGVADEATEIARLETTGNYPHNGLCGLAVDRSGGLFFGLGENLGAEYRLVGADGTTLAGGGEGGNVYHCTLEGAGLERVATGFWNPFGLCVDPAGRLFVVDNDPDASPPCRLLHVVAGGDYGYQFRFGRSGRHPLQAWDGELPGTLPMVAGTGEAPCEAIVHQRALWVASWGDNRLERYTLVPHGASFTANREVVVQGDRDFRPVGLAVGPDGSLYFTDWVDRSYALHKRGRIWRLTTAGDAATSDWPALTDAERRAAQLRTTTDESTLAAALADADPFVRQAAVASLANVADLPSRIDDLLTTSSDGMTTLGVLEAIRLRGDMQGTRANGLFRQALTHDDPRVCLFALRCVAERGDKESLADVEALWDRTDLTPQLIDAALATADWLAGRDGVEAAARRSERLLSVVDDAHRSSAVRTMALHRLPPDDRSLSIERLSAWATGSDAALRREAIRTLAIRENDDRMPALARLVADESLSDDERADAAVGLLNSTHLDPNLRSKLAQHPVPSVREVSRRRADEGRGDGSGATRPAPADIDAWLARVDDQPGDPNAGWRAFWTVGGGRCSACHGLDGRGGGVGPDLAGVAARMSRRRLLESILDPSREVAPRYQSWTVVTTGGQAFTALSLGKIDEDRRERFVGADGIEFVLETADIESRSPSSASIMPTGLERLHSPDDLRDLMALLAAPVNSTAAGAESPRIPHAAKPLAEEGTQ